jgi:hypothetical protein
MSNRNDERVYRTRDVSLAGWLTMHGLELKSYNRAGRDFQFAFYDPEDRATRLAIRWPSSEASRFDSAIRSLKKLWNANK